MLNFKFIDIEELYLNKFKSLQEEDNFWKKKYPHIFFPTYDFKKFENNSLYLEVFLPWHHEIVMLHNNLYNYYNLGKSIKASYESLSDKYLPDKAIDIMDEAGSRAHMINMKVPKEVTDLEKEIEKVRSEKNSVVVAQKFEDAASFRDIEQKLLNKLSKLQKNWKLDEKSNPVKITENDIADMISMVTTIPVNKVAPVSYTHLTLPTTPYV